MKKHPLLKKLYKDYKKYYDLKWHQENILVLSGSEGFYDAIMIYQKESPDTVIFSVNASSTDAPLVASMAIAAMYSVPVRYGQPFYIDTQGKWYFGEDAISVRDAEIAFELDEEMSDKTVH